MGRVLDNKNHNDGTHYYSISISLDCLRLKSLKDLIKNSKILYIGYHNKSMVEIILRKYDNPINGNALIGLKRVLPYFYIDRVLDETYYSLWVRLRQKKIHLKDETVYFHAEKNVMYCETGNYNISMDNNTKRVIITGKDEPLSLFDFEETDLRQRAREVKELITGIFFGYEVFD